MYTIYTCGLYLPFIISILSLFGLEIEICNQKQIAYFVKIHMIWRVLNSMYLKLRSMINVNKQIKIMTIWKVTHRKRHFIYFFLLTELHVSIANIWIF